MDVWHVCKVCGEFAKVKIDTRAEFKVLKCSACRTSWTTQKPMGEQKHKNANQKPDERSSKSLF
jgi:ribosomal protein L37AE/L43A